MGTLVINNFLFATCFTQITSSLVIIFFFSGHPLCSIGQVRLHSAGSVSPICISGDKCIPPHECIPHSSSLPGTDQTNDLSKQPNATSFCSPSVRSNKILLNSGVMNIPQRPQTFSVPLTVLSSSLSSDQSDKSPVGTPVKDNPAALHKRSTNVHSSTNQEDLGSLSEQAWDPYQETKYISENYSEDIDSDAVRKFLERGDDYGRFLDSDGGSSFLGIPKLKGSLKSSFLNECDSDWSLASSRQRGLDLRRSSFTSQSRSCTNTQATSEMKCEGQQFHPPQGDTANRSQGHSGPDNDKQNDSLKVNDNITPIDCTKLEKSAGRSLARRYRTPGPLHPPRGEIDSDSDIEDIVTLIEESRAQLVAAENVLSKHSDEVASTQMMDYVSLTYSLIN